MRKMGVVVACLLFFSVATNAVLAAEPQKDKEAQKVLLSLNKDALISGATFDKILSAGSWEGELGMMFRSEDPDDGDQGDAGWGFFEAAWESGSLNGFQVGLGGLFVTELWQSGSLDSVFDDDFSENGKWTEAYLKYTFPSEKTYFIIGRADDGKFGEPATGDGDFYEGVGITMGEIPRVKVRAHVVKEWLNNASASWDLDGIDGSWEEMDNMEIENNAGVEVEDTSGDVAYTVMGTVSLGYDQVKNAEYAGEKGLARVMQDGLCECFNISPYVQIHSDVGTSYGVNVETFQTISDGIVFHVDGAYETFQEDTPSSINAVDEDFNQWTIHPYLEIHDFQIGAGYYTMSDDVLVGNDSKDDDLNDLFVVDEMDPLEEDGIYGENPSNETFFVDAGYSYGPFSLSAVYGWVDDARTGLGNTKGEATELDVILGVQVTENIEAELAYMDVNDDYKDDGDGSGQVVAGGITWSF